MKMTNKYIETRTRSRITLAQESRKQMALINQCCGRNGKKAGARWCLA